MPEVLKRVGRYDLLDVIGRGGAAVVYLAHQRDLRRNVALKELAPFHAADATFAERFVDESRLAGSLSHANVVVVHEFFEDAGVPYIAMEYLPHGSLRQYIGNLSTAQIAGVLEGVLAGLSAGEAQGIVHRDLKPENLLVAGDGRVKIADFGVARALNKAATRAVVTVAGTTIGTPTYMSPEQALGTTLTPATDLYSLGVVSWEMLTGQVPFEETDTPVAVLYRHVHEPVPSVLTVNPDVDPAIAAWLERMLEKAPENRFQSADEAWIALEDVVLELLGPRWRREARLAVEEGDRRQEKRSLTPAEFPASQEVATPEEPGVPAAPDASPPPVRATVTDEPAAVQPEATVAPKQRPQRSHTTMMRIARRHADAGEGDGESAPDAMRRRLAVLGVVAAMAAAIAAGLLVANSGSSGPSAAQLAAQRQAAARRAEVTSTDHRLASIMQGFAATDTRDQTALGNASTSQAQAADATILQHAFARTAAQVKPLDADSPAAAPLHATLTGMAAGYGKLATAARAGRSGAYGSAAAAIRKDQTTLFSEVSKL
jgi:serine/threonine protein kinase